MFKNRSIRSKLLFMLIGAIFFISTSLMIQSLLSLTNISEHFIERSSASSYKIKEKEVKNYVSLAYKTMQNYYARTAEDKIKAEVEKHLKNQTEYLFSIIGSEYEKNKNLISPKELQERLKSIIRASKFAQSGYFFGYNDQGISIVHGANQSNEGKNLLHVKDKNGVYIVKEIIKAGISEESEGFVSYHWEKPGHKKLQLKVAFVKKFKPYGWILVTGAYVDDVTEKMKQEALLEISKMQYGKNGYFWVNDSKYIIRAHGEESTLVGKNVYDVKDKKGMFLYREIVDIANKNKEGGLLNYYWEKPDSQDISKKISYVKKFEPWDFIIGTGVYSDDVQKEVLAMEESTKKDVQSTIITFIMILTIVSVFVIIGIWILMNKIIFYPLNNFQSGLLDFFKYLNKEKNDILPLHITSDDEIGKMTSLINENIQKTQIIMEYDDLLIKDVKQIVNHVSNGYLDKKITTSTSNESLEELKVLLNDMLSNIQKLVGDNINKLSEVLEEYSKRDFTKQLDASNSGKIGLDIIAMNKMITRILQDNEKGGGQLQTKSTQLSLNVKVLNENATSQAASLEETAASIEEITGNIQQTSQKAQEMLRISSETLQSADTGKDLASKTVKSMDTINETVLSINEAIMVIDQIAFQTNILSLNAAVEAATAGEAGKGFAVVAQEVRNLASRSAEAAKEIKALVESATIKANDGKEISSAMIEGFSELEVKIDKTNTLIDDVSNAAKEQSAGITQISDAVNQLDKFTQENASIADEANSIAKQTNEIAIEVVENVAQNKFNKLEK